MLHLNKVKIEIVQIYFCIRKRCELLFKNDSCFLRGPCSLNTVNSDQWKTQNDHNKEKYDFVAFPYIWL